MSDFKDFIEWCKENVRILKTIFKQIREDDQRKKDNKSI
jgi:hypothetical protein